MAEPPRRYASPSLVVPNDTYLNFIKKNQTIINNEVAQKTHQKSRLRMNNRSLDVPKRFARSQKKELSPFVQRSLVEFDKELQQARLTKQKFQTTNGYPAGDSQKEKEKNAYQTISQHHSSTTAFVMSRTRHAKHQAAKELLLKIHRNKVSDSKKTGLRESIGKIKQSSEEKEDEPVKLPTINQKQTIRQEFDSTIEENMEEERSNLTLEQKAEAELLGKTEESLDHSSFMTIGPKTLRYYDIDKSASRFADVDKSSLKRVLREYLEENVVMKTLNLKSQQTKEEKQKRLRQMRKKQRQYYHSVLVKKESVQLMSYITPFNDEKQHSREHTKMDTSPTKSQSLADPKATGSMFMAEPKPDELTVYDIKIRHYREFVFMMNLAHRVFDPVILKPSHAFRPEARYKFHLGRGNNYLLVKSLLKRRFWWKMEDNYKNANFVWTQLKINYFYQYQGKSSITSKHYKLQEDVPPQQHTNKKKKAADLKKQTQTHSFKSSGMFRAPFPASPELKIFTNSDKYHYDTFMQKCQNLQKSYRFKSRLQYMQTDLLRGVGNKESQRVHNHFECNYHIGNKKAMFYNLKHYYDLQGKNVFDIIPLTFHIKNGALDHCFEQFCKEWRRIKKQNKVYNKNMWIVKPGQVSNRGQGITVIDEIYELKNIFKKKQRHYNGQQKTYIVQKYLQRPLLYKGRKFDIRHYMMISRLHGVMRAYWFGEGYIRTASYEYRTGNIEDKMIHLTNDAIQQHCAGYGKFQEGNKVSYNEFQRYMDSTYPQSKFNFANIIYPQMKSIALDAIKATYLQMDPQQSQHNFEIFGLDFMIDLNYKVWLIEINTNPCLQISSKLLERIIPTMLEHTFRLTLDVLFPPPCHYVNSQKYMAPDASLQRLQFELIFDENRDGKEIEELFSKAKPLEMGEVDEDDETFDNDGKQFQFKNEDE